MSARELPKVPESWEELLTALQELERGVHDPEVAYGPNTDGYGKCVEAMARAGYIAHEYLARILGVTGFQHSMSSLSVVGMLRNIEGPYMLLDADQALYPQYDIAGKVVEWLGSDDMRTWLADQAQLKLDEVATRENALVAGHVVEHWRKLIANRPV